jgi:hypothetical protein
MSETDDPVRAAQAARAREDLNRRLQTNLDLGRAITFQPTSRSHAGAWNLFLACLGAVIVAAIVIVNVYF